MAPKILVVDDEETILKLVTFNLEREGFHTLTAADGRSALEKIRREKPDLVILDVMLPEIDGFSLCRLLRQEGVATPILMLTARNGEIDKVLGLELGADDYLTKPFSVRELVARVRAILRRVREGESPPEEKLVCGDLEVYPGRYEVRVRGRVCPLTPREFELLVLFCRNQGLVLSREFILRKVWGYDYFGEARVVDVHVSKLREKIEDDPSNPRYIKTVRGVGYKLVGG